MKYLSRLLFLSLISTVAVFFAPQCARAVENFTADNSANVTIPSGVKVELTLTIALRANKTGAGDPIYAETNYPVTVGGTIAIPAGTYVQGVIESVTQPTRKSNRAEMQVLFTKIIYANGYTVVLPSRVTSVNVSGNAGAQEATAAETTRVTAMHYSIQVTPYNDLLLDNGAQFEMALASPLTLDASEVEQSVPMTHALVPGQFKSATVCRFIPGSPGTPDTFIPGTPGTPSTTIPGGPGMPDIVIPGTPDTPSTTIPGTPDTPPTYCPQAPFVITSTPAL